jgi:hypothetical protein
MESVCGGEFPATWVARLVERSRMEFDVLQGLELELIADGCDEEFDALLSELGGGEACGRVGDDGALSMFELRDMYSDLIVPTPEEYGDVEVFGGVDQFRLTCAFVLGVLGRWDEALMHLGGVPGKFDRTDPRLFSSRLDVVTAMAEDGRWEDVVAHAEALSFDCEQALGEGSALSVVVMVLRGEALTRLGRNVDALRLFRLALEVGENADGVEELVLESAREHEMFLVLGSLS